MSEVFKVGDIANIINDTNNEIKIKKQTKLSKKFKDIIADNKNKLIKIQKIGDQIKDNNDSIVEEEDDEEEEVAQTEELTEEQKLLDQKDKNERTTYVGNLPNTVCHRRLKKMFSKFGEIETIRLRGAVPQKEKMSKKVAIITKSLHSKKNNIIAYIVFKSKDSVLKSLKLNGIVLDEHHIRVDRAANDNSHDSSRSVFVGNLPFDVKEEELYTFFEGCGTIEAVRVVRDSKTGIGKGFGFVLFKSRDSVVLALEKNDKKIGKRDIRVTRAKYTQNKPQHNFKRKNTDLSEQQSHQKVNKKFKASNSKADFEGVSARRAKKKTNKKKEIKTTLMKRQQKKLAQIFFK